MQTSKLSTMLMNRKTQFKSLCDFPPFKLFSWSSKNSATTRIQSSATTTTTTTIAAAPRIAPVNPKLRSNIDGRFFFSSILHGNKNHSVPLFSRNPIVHPTTQYKSRDADVEKMGLSVQRSKINEGMGNAGRFWMNYSKKESTLLVLQSAVALSFQILLLRLISTEGLNKFILNTLSFWKMFVDDMDFDDDDNDDDDDNEMVRKQGVEEDNNDAAPAPAPAPEEVIIISDDEEMVKSETGSNNPNQMEEDLYDNDTEGESTKKPPPPPPANENENMKDEKKFEQKQRNDRDSVLVHHPPPVPEGNDQVWIPWDNPLTPYIEPDHTPANEYEPASASDPPANENKPALPANENKPASANGNGYEDLKDFNSFDSFSDFKDDL